MISELENDTKPLENNNWSVYEYEKSNDKEKTTIYDTKTAVSTKNNGKSADSVGICYGTNLFIMNHLNFFFPSLLDFHPRIA